MPCKSIYGTGEDQSDRSCKILYEVKDEVDILQTTKLRKDIWIGHTMRWGSLLNRLIEAGEEEDEDLSSCWMTLR
jgi:hypothetical protein